MLGSTPLAFAFWFSASAVASEPSSVNAIQSGSERPNSELVSFPGNGTTLGGFLYRPEGAGPFPAVIFNHGSEKLPGNKMGQAMFFVRRGYVLFVPHRRGHGRSPGDYLPAEYTKLAPSDGDRVLADGLVAQVDDVEAAVNFVRSLSYVDTRRVFMSGCSFGGIMTALASQRSLGVRAGVDFSGAAATWSTSPRLQDKMRAAVRQATFPIFFAQAENDFDTTPSKALAAEMKKAGKPYKLKIYPAHGSTAEDGHGFCAGGDNPAWGVDVLAFFEIGK